MRIRQAEKHLTTCANTHHLSVVKREGINELLEARASCHAIHVDILVQAMPSLGRACEIHSLRSGGNDLHLSEEFHNLFWSS